MTGPDAAGPGSTWRVVAVSTAATGLGAAPAFLVGYVGADVRSELGLSRGELGLLISVFFGGTGLASMLGGRSAALLGARVLVAVDMAAVAVALVALSVLTWYPALVAAMLVSGAAYALLNVGTNLAVAAAVPPARHGFALTLKTAGVPTMATVLALVAPGVAAWHGYRPVAAAIAVVAAVVLALTLASLPSTGRVIGRRGGRPRPVRLPRGFGWLPVASFLLIAGSQPLLSWITSYGHEVGGFSVPAVGIAAATGTAVGAVVMIVVAAASDRAGPARRGRFVVVACTVCCFGTVLVWAGGTGWYPVLLVGAVLGVAGNLVSAGLTHSLVVDRAPAAVARATGWTMTGYYAGALAAPGLFGVVADGPGGYAAAWAGCVVALLLAVVAYGRVHRWAPLLVSDTSSS